MKFLIKGKQWKVRSRVRLKSEDGIKCDGLCDYDNRTIFINKNLSPEDKIDTLVHEFLHAVFHEMHLDLGSIADEMIVRGVTEYLLENFKISLKAGR